ncbi:gamma-glutamylcyclotransferase family protein [Roseibium limicola]|uniref:Gamma-glutamylcyclotransferase n=1 Tax=Roseibium limicola TaxID=2816037 RepID=A0A939JA58_9HYPH|nr:gamma-glutamylcyclotransferase family protein [Roseibium limicola]MBO0346103.1 gamma-glutamylcyclotransferase [Roseibium limicola]
MTISYFGYGSLVNTATLPSHTQVTPGTLTGWVRQWSISGRETAKRGVCSLCVVRKEGAQIRGVLASEPRDGLARLEQREYMYDKVSDVGHEFRADEKGGPGPQDMFLFQAKAAHYAWGDAANPILQSYVDCVLTGFHNFWGEEGVRHFFDTTEGWHVPILADRAAPQYPRAIVLDPHVRDLIDGCLGELGVTYLKDA